MSERRACRLVELDRSSYGYEPRADHNAELREELVKLARQKPRYGYRRLHVLLNKRGHPASAQRIYRLYREERLMVRRLRRKRLVRPANQGRQLLRANQEWALDFACDALATGRGIRILAIVDAFTRECLTLEPAPAKTRVARKTARSSFKAALQLARTFPSGVLASQACPYCYNTGYSSRGTRCSYCRDGKR